ncbi:MAG: hypothetical protein JXD22_07410 [Sedimentisphaerales bacterium]|nr:hypothetical protein [Sedimentisphaerales bacterium]
MAFINNILSTALAALNIAVNALANIIFAPIGFLPGWLSNTIISAVMGVLLLILFKYTSNQKAIGRTRDYIKANMLALKLFKDELSITFVSQGKVFLGAFRLLFHSLRPLLVMMVPAVMILAQMAGWYQFRPLKTGETALVTIKLNNADPKNNNNPNGNTNRILPEVSLAPSPAAEMTIGPVRIAQLNEIRWQIQARQIGQHNLTFNVAGQDYHKQLHVGPGLQKISPLRPGWKWYDIILYPLEKPFPADSPIQEISIDYPNRPGWADGSNNWMIYFFLVSMAFALLFKSALKVKI